ncbi:MAG: quinone oxidoreductase [Dehalococcoidia bacterium]
MKAVRFHEHGGPEVLRYDDVADPSPTEGQALIRLHAIGVNFIDTYQRAGNYQVPLPYIAGQEGAGEVLAVGPGVTAVKPGDRVAYTGVPGAYAEQALAPADKLVKLPRDISYETAAAAMLQGMTAHYLSHSTYSLGNGDTCLIHAAAGGVGLLLTQMAKMRGATVIGTVSTPEKAETAKAAGADHIVLYTQEDFVEKVKEVTGGKGLPVVYDSVGKDTFEKSLECLAPRGFMVLYGQSSGPVAPFNPQILNAKGSLFLTRPSLAHYTLTREDLEWRAGDVLGWAASGNINVHIGETHPLADAAEAHRRLQGRATTGKVLLLP